MEKKVRNIDRKERVCEN